MLTMVLGAVGCFAAAHDVPAGTVLAAADLTPAVCRSDAPRASLRYDRTAGAPVAVTALPAGTYLGRLMPLSARQVAAGEPLVLRSSAGPVVIERSVTAMQPGRAGKRLFVRDAEGRVFAVRYVVEDEQ